MAIITLAKVKELLGISGTTYDTAITAQIPVIEAKLKLVTNNRFQYQMYGDYDNGSTYVEVSSLYSYAGSVWEKAGVGQYCMPEDIQDYLTVGDIVTGTDIPADTYITNIYSQYPTVKLGGTDYTSPVIELSQAVTATGSGEQLLTSVNIGQQDIIAKGIWYLIQQTSTKYPDSGWTSKTMGPLSVTKGSAGSRIDGRSGMPLWFTNAFGVYQRGF